MAAAHIGRGPLSPVKLEGIDDPLLYKPRSLVLFAILYDLLSLAEERSYWLLPVPLLMALWVNLHGAFVAGLILVAGFTAGVTWDAWPDGLRRRIYR